MDRRRLPSWISLNDNLSVKKSNSSSSCSPYKIIDEDELLPSRCVGVGGKNMINSNTGATTSPRNRSQHHKRSFGKCSEKIRIETSERTSFDDRKSCEETKTNSFELNKSVSLNIEVDDKSTFRIGLAQVCSHRNCYDPSHPDWKLVRDFMYKATYHLVAPQMLDEIGIERQSDANTLQEIGGHVLYRPTILGFLCQLNMSESCYLTSDEIQRKNDLILETFRTVLQLCPEQVYCSQRYVGHTPLRDAACNPTFLPEVMELMILSIPRPCFQQSIKILDLNDLTPIDHIVRMVQIDDLGGNKNGHNTALRVLKKLLKYANSTILTSSEGETITSSKPHLSSPLVRLLSLGTSFGCSYVMSDEDNGGVGFSQQENESPDLSTCNSWDGSTGNTSPSRKGKPAKKHNTTLSPKSERSAERRQQHQRDVRKSNQERSEEKRSDDRTLDIGRLSRILKCIQLLLDWDPMLLYRKSSLTDCSVLHVAIRNYGNYMPIIDELIQRNSQSADTKTDEVPDQSNCRFPLLLHRNRFGDLPIHVACSVGVPMNILRTILKETTFSGCHNELSGGSRVPNSVLWSYNYSGYTPIDLEWIRHIEVGCYFHSYRTFYPLDSRGIMQQRYNQRNQNDPNNTRYEDMYEKLLRQAVDQVMKQHEHELSLPHLQDEEDQNRTGRNLLLQEKLLGVQRLVTQHPPCELDAVEQAKTHDNDGATVGLLLQRIFLVIRSAFESSSSCQLVRSTTDANDMDKNARDCYGCSDYILHMACALSSPSNGPVLPLPLLELILWMYPEQLRQRESIGNSFPLHLTLRHWKTPQCQYQINYVECADPCRDLHIRRESVSDKAREEWKSWIQKLITKWPGACCCTDSDGRLPIHHALESMYNACQAHESDKTVGEEDVATNDIVQELIQEYPQSLEVVDPISKFFPYQQAAVNPMVSLNTLYFLLRRSPSRIVQ